jgi:hypothetical protein
MVGQLVSVLGKKGMGKTLFLTRRAVRSDLEVWANYKLNIPNFKSLTISDLINIPKNILILIDEAYTWFESRISGSVLNRYLSYMIFQLRKTYSDIYLSAQRWSTLDVRVRMETDVIVKCERKNNGIRPIDKLPEGKNENGIRVPYYYFWDYKYSFLDIETLNEKSYILPYEKAKVYFDKYDTSEIIEPAFKERMELELLQDNPKKLLEKVKKVSETIMKDVNEITHDTIKIALMKNGFSHAYEPFVYNYVKKKVDFK